jgi:hypothetical protein
VHDAGGLTVGGLRVALGSSDAAVLRAAERERACIGQPEWIATASTQALPPADWTVAVPLWGLCLLAGSSGGWEGIFCQGRWAPSAPVMAG